MGMYTSYYNLTAPPFETTTDPHFLWLGDKHKEALATLRYGINEEKGFILLTGDAGTGKTTLVNALLQDLGGDTLVANISSNAGLDDLGFLKLISRSFHIFQQFDRKEDFLISFESFLRKAHLNNKRVLLIIDEAHNLSKERLEQIRFLSNIELPDKKLINIFLVGQEELHQKLKSPFCRALRQRITVQFRLTPLSKNETTNYIRFRLKVAGAGRYLFNRKAIRKIHRFSEGYPRLINKICDRALLTGFVKELSIVTPDIIKECSREVLLPGETKIDVLFKFLKPLKTAAIRPFGGDEVVDAIIDSETTNSQVKRLGYGTRTKEMTITSAEAQHTSPSLRKKRFSWLKRRALLYRTASVFVVISVVAIVFLFFKGYFTRFDAQKLIAGVIDTPAATPTKEGRPVTIPVYSENNPGQTTDSPKVAPLQAVSETPQSASVKAEHPVTSTALDAGTTQHATDSSNASPFNAGSETPQWASVKVEHPTIPTALDDGPRNRAKSPSKPSLFSAGSEPSRSSSLDMAYKALREKKFNQAIAFFEETVTYQPEQLSTFRTRYAQALLGQAGSIFDKNPNEAEILLCKAAEIDPQNADAHNKLGKLYTQMNNYSKAIDAYQKAAELDPRSPDIYFNLGYLYARTKNYGHAEKMLRRVAELNPSYLDKAVFNLAMVQLKQGKKRECAENLEKSLAINPDNQKARKYLERLKDSQGETR